MKVIRKQKEKLVFLLEAQEQPLFLTLLRRYPLAPSAGQPLSKSIVSKESAANQQLLDDALAEQRQENKQTLEKLLKAPRRFRKVVAGWHLTLSAPEVECLLQVLNDVRVGSWSILGSPDMKVWDFELNGQTVPHAWAMELAGYFQMHLLEAMHGGPA